MEAVQVVSKISMDQPSNHKTDIQIITRLYRVIPVLFLVYTLDIGTKHLSMSKLHFSKSIT